MGKISTISVVIPILNEEKNLDRCLGSVVWVDDILVVDMGSTDKSVEVCKKYGAKIIKRVPKNGNFDDNRLFGMQNTTSDWILKLDADEELTKELQEEIKILLNDDPVKDIDGYFLRNKIFMFGKEIKHGFVKPCSNEFRLFRKDKWKYNPTRFHQQITVTGKTGFLKNYYYHYNNKSISQFISKTNRYTDLDSKYFFNHNTRFSLFGVYLSFFKIFLKLFVIQKGFLDGTLGLITCSLYSFYYWLEKLKVYELEHFGNGVRDSGLRPE